MYFGLDVPTTGAYADARVLAELAADAEAAGWDGFFVWDVLGDQTTPAPAVDPWIALTALALQTSRIRLGTMVTPLARHRPWLVARRLANLDHLSGGRMVCTVGLGYQAEDYQWFGQDASPTVRAELLDESLAIIAGLWAEERFSFSGKHYTLTNVCLLPRPLQTPRIPLWVAGGWPRTAPFRRAARWDGACLMSVHAERRAWLTLVEFAECVGYLREQRASHAPFTIVMSGEYPDDPREAGEKLAAFARAGATWWVEEGLGWELAEFRERIRRGPPRR